MSNRIKLNQKGRAVVTLISTIALGFVFWIAIMGVTGHAGQVPEKVQPTKCISGTYLQPDNSCLPPNSTRG